MKNLKKLIYTTVLVAIVLANTAIAQSQDGSTYEQIVQAIDKLELDKVKQLITKSNINQKDIEGLTPLHHAARTNYYHRLNNFSQSVAISKEKESAVLIKFLLDMGADINAVDEFGKTALMYGATKITSDITEELLKAKPNLNILDKEGRSALYYALSTRKEKTVKLLTDAGAQVDNLCLNTACSQSFPLELIKVLVKKVDDIKNGLSLISVTQTTMPDLDVFKYLISAGADVNAKDNEGNTALMNLFPFNSYRYPLIKTLLEAKADVNIKNNGGQTCLSLLAKNAVNQDSLWTLEIMKLIFAARANINSVDTFGNTPLMDLLIVSDWLESPVILFLEAGADVNIKNKEGKTALELAFKGKESNPRVIKALLEKTSRVSFVATHHATPLTWACEQGHIEIVKLLIKKGANVNSAANNKYTDYTYPIMWAAASGQTEIVKLLIAHKANVNVKGKAHWYTPLMLAAHFGHSETVKVLLAAKASVLARTKGGLTPLMFAVSKGDEESTRLLIAAKSDVNAVGEGRPVLHHALSSGSSPALIKMLIDAKANVNTIEYGGYRPVFFALDSPEVLKMLIAAKANLNVKLETGETPLSLAKQGNNQEIIDLIEKAGGK